MFATLRQIRMKIEHLHKAIALVIILMMCCLQLAPVLHHHSFAHSEYTAKKDGSTHIAHPNVHCSFCDKTFQSIPHKVLPKVTLVLVKWAGSVQKIEIKRTKEVILGSLYTKANKGPPLL